ncbi:LacI family DNA-binding transcriptional regulator [Saccharothrix deserti]|uniref:LacI family DNA-binding transcriptional regulator n=1 Tax=Saccharothrix deserti TaxID=2593674 RepID=UPI00131DEB7A|nr:LacI family DNA-binding transcriptional regulator [Saccharothrix deserti]
MTTAKSNPPEAPRPTGGSKPAGIKDVAERAGVSVGTVSNVLNHPERVSHRTKARVETAMADLGFVPNEFARQLRSGRSNTVAYVMLDASNPFFIDVARGIEEAADAADVSLFSCNSDNRVSRESTYLNRLEQQRVQGILITPIDPDAAILDELPQRGTPVVIVDRNRGGNTHCTVAVDDVLGGALAVQHLIEAGHERIAYIGGPDTLGQVRDRRLGALKAVTEAGMAPDALVDLRTSALSVAEGRNAGERLAGLPAATRPTAAFCANDLLALGLLQTCVGLRIRVPTDLAIVGYDDIDFAAAAAVPLTSVRQPRLDLGRTAAKFLLDEAGNPNHEHSQVLFTPELVVRASTQRRQ